MQPKAPRITRCCSLGFSLGLATLLSGCTGAPRWGAWSKAPTQAQIATVLGRVEAKAQSQAAFAQTAPREQPKPPVLTVSMP